MLWTLLAYIFFWLAFFCWVLVGLLYFSEGAQSEGLKKLAHRFAQTPAESLHIQGLMKRFGILFIAAGIFFFLLSTPTGDMTPEQRGKLTLLEVACVLAVVWQVKSIRDYVKVQSGPGSR